MRALLLLIVALLFASPAAAEETRADLIYVPSLEVISEEVAFEQAVLVRHGAVFERAVLYRNSIGTMPVHTDGLAIIPIDYQLEDDSLYIVVELGAAELMYGFVESEDMLLVADTWGIWGDVADGPGRMVGLGFSSRIGNVIF